MKQAIIIITSEKTKPFLKDLWYSLEGCEYPIVVIENTPTNNQFEMGAIKYGMSVYDEFFILHDTTIIKDLAIFDIVFKDYEGCSVYFGRDYESYLGKYRTEILKQIEIPLVRTKAEAVYYEQAFNKKYISLEPNLIELFPRFWDNEYNGNAVYEYKYGRKNLISENKYLKKYKGTWGLDMILDYEEIWKSCVNHYILQKYDEFIPTLKWLEANLASRKHCLEIGSNSGGTAYGLSYLFEDVLSVDIFEDRLSWGNAWQTVQLQRGNIRFLEMDSHSLSFRLLLSELPYKFDCIFIDGDHMMPGIQQDYEIAKDYLADNGVIFFHDIIYQNVPAGCQVDELWNNAVRKDVDNNLFSKVEIISLEQDKSKATWSWIDNYTHDRWGGIGILKKKVDLTNVTMICIDCIDLERAEFALKFSMQGCKFGAVKMVSSLCEPHTENGINYINCLPINSPAEYSQFVLKELWRLFDTEYCLIVQYDGYILNPEAFEKEWFGYDYIGAAWEWDKTVGNGGFSLRSKKLCELLGNDDNMQLNGANEDVAICQSHRHYLEEKGFVFAPLEEARKFSIEGGVWGGQFGFHSLKLTLIPDNKKRGAYAD